MVDDEQVRHSGAECDTPGAGVASLAAVRVTVTASRGNPLSWPIALLFTIVGAALIVLGFTVFGKVSPTPDDGGIGGSIMTFIAFLLIVPPWCFYLVYLVRRGGQRRNAAEEIPAELPEPPSSDDPAVVGAVVNQGSPSGRAVAGTILALAARGAVDIQEHGPKVVVVVSPEARGATPTDNLVLGGLRARADERGHVSGPPLWQDDPPWWGDYVRDARSRAVTAGLVETRIPFVGLMLVSIFTATGLAILFFWYLAAFIGFILLANGLPHLVARASGYRLTAAGIAERGRWLAFGRYIDAHQSLRDVGAAGVAMWGPNLVYGVLLGEGDRAAQQLAPDVGRDRFEPEQHEFQKTVEL